jgi:chemotaxis signal transduction protein
MAGPLGVPEAMPPEAAPAADLFAVRAGADRWAFDPGLVAEVVRLGPLTRLPMAPPFLAGVFAHRGQVLAVLDLSQLLGQAPVALGPGTRAAVVRAGPFEVALVADDLLGLCAVEPDSTLAEGGPAAPFRCGWARDGLGPLAVLDLPRLVESARARSLGR